MRRREDSWLERWIETVADLARLKESHPMLDAVIDEQVGRRIRIGDHWLFDFASCNYLGFDLDQEIIDVVPEYLAKWGTHPSWSRLLGSPVLYEQIEEKTTELLGSEDTLLLPTITHIHMSVIPVLADVGTVFLDARAHKTIYDGCSVARAHGATIHRFAHNDLDQLESLLRQHAQGPRVIFQHCPYAAIVAQHPEVCDMDRYLLRNMLELPAQQVAKLEMTASGIPQCVFKLG